MRKCLIFFFNIMWAVIFISCKAQNSQGENCLNNEFFNIALGMDEFSNTNHTEEIKFFKALNVDSFESSYSLLNLQHPFIINFFSVNEKKQVAALGKEKIYQYYRLAESLGNETESNLNNKLLLITAPYITTIDSNSCYYKLIEIESSFLDFYSQSDSVYKRASLVKFSKYFNMFSNSNRIKYLFAKMNFDAGFPHIAKPIFLDLLKRNYNVRLTLNYFFEYYLKDNLDSIRTLSNSFSSSYINRCNLGNLRMYLLNGQEDAFRKECGICFRSERIIDSVKAQLFLAKLYLKKRDFKKILYLYKLYKDRNTNDFDFSEFKTWELGEYYDVMLKSLFLQKKFKEMFLFIVKDVGMNNRIKIESDADFYDLIESYYKEYYPQSIGSFDVFFKKNFEWVHSKFKV